MANISEEKILIALKLSFFIKIKSSLQFNLNETPA